MVKIYCINENNEEYLLELDKNYWSKFLELIDFYSKM